MISCDYCGRQIGPKEPFRRIIITDENAGRQPGKSLLLYCEQCEDPFKVLVTWIERIHDLRKKHLA